MTNQTKSQTQNVNQNAGAKKSSKLVKGTKKLQRPPGCAPIYSIG